MGNHGALIHEPQDDVAVVVLDVREGENVLVKTLEGTGVANVKARENIPLGHKISLRSIAKGSKVFKYGHCIGIATHEISKGTHVHVHNIKSLRWQ